MYRVRVREEKFAYIVSLPNGWIDIYDKKAKYFIDSMQLDKLDQYRLGKGEKIFEYKESGVLPPYYYNIPDYVYTSSCPIKSPIVVQVALTLKCNLSCKFCYTYADKAKNNELSLSEIKSVLTQLKKLEVMSVFFTGGEPTLRPDFVEILEFADQLDLDFFVITNGTKITPELLEKVPKRTYFILSFDGIDSHKNLHGGLDFSGMCRVFELLKLKNIAFTAQYVLQRDNVDDLINTYKWCASNEIDLAALDINMAGRAKHNLDIFPTHEQMKSFEKLALAKFEYEKVQALWEEKSNYKDIPNPYHFAFISRLEEIFERSYSGVFFAYIASDGNVYPDNWHGGERMFLAGNIRDEELGNIWKNSFSDIRELVNWKNWHLCNSCAISRGYCDYRLPVFSNNIHGNYSTCGATNFQKELILMRTKMRKELANVRSNDMARAIDIW